MRWGMVVDLSKCMRCHGCIAACRVEHFLPLGMLWCRLIAWEESAEEMTTYPIRCNHCQEPPCVYVCPTGASQKREEDGIVWIDQNLCVGCRYCTIACPYQNRLFMGMIKTPVISPDTNRLTLRKPVSGYTHTPSAPTKSAISVWSVSMPEWLRDSNREWTVKPPPPASIPARPERLPSAIWTTPTAKSEGSQGTTRDSSFTLSMILTHRYSISTKGGEEYKNDVTAVDGNT